MPPIWTVPLRVWGTPSTLLNEDILFVRRCSGLIHGPSRKTWPLRNGWKAIARRNEMISLRWCCSWFQRRKETVWRHVCFEGEHQWGGQ
ncbi:hypothetical protein MHYP_G00202890 [Metynnis hypsauchen]